MVTPLVGSGIGRIKFISDIYQLLAVRLLPQKDQLITTTEGFKMMVLTDGHISDIATELLFKKEHEPTTTKIFKAIIKQGDYVIDVGANIGYFSLLSSKLVGTEGMVWAFEPDKDNVKALINNVMLNKYENVRIRDEAVSDKTGQLTLYTSSKESARHSLIKTKEHDGQTTVNVVKLDSELFDLQKPIAFLKTDTEGNELGVLKSAQKLIKESPDIKLLVEVYEDALNACGTKVETLWLYLISNLNMRYVYFVDDYTDRIINIYNPNQYNMGWEKLSKNKLACNLLCSRTPIDNLL
jgi:FkbM family methyltransferase